MLMKKAETACASEYSTTIDTHDTFVDMILDGVTKNFYGNSCGRERLNPGEFADFSLEKISDKFVSVRELFEDNNLTVYLRKASVEVPDDADRDALIQVCIWLTMIEQLDVRNDLRLVLVSTRASECELG